MRFYTYINPTTEFLRELYERWPAGGTVAQIISCQETHKLLQKIVRVEYTKNQAVRLLRRLDGQETKVYRCVNVSNNGRLWTAVKEEDKPFVARRATAAELHMMDVMPVARRGCVASYILESMTNEDQRKVFGRRVKPRNVAAWLSARKNVWLRVRPLSDPLPQTWYRFASVVVDGVPNRRSHRYRVVNQPNDCPVCWSPGVEEWNR